MKRRTWLKLLLVAGLMAVVCSTVQWSDRLAFCRGTDAARKVVRTEAVTIEGPWNVPAVAVNDGSGTRTVRDGDVVDGLELEVQPGFLCYWQNLDRGLFALGAAAYFLTVLIAGARWWWLLRVNGMDVSLVESLRFTWIGVFFNTVMPGATGGDLIKALYIMKRCPGHRVPALVSVIVDRVLGLASLAILGAVVVLFSLDRFLEIAIAIWAVILGLALLGVVAFSRRLRAKVRLTWLLERLPHRLSNLLRLFDQAVFVYRGHKRVIAASLLAGVGNHVLSVMSVVWVGDALGVGMPWTEYFVLIPIINMITAVPLMPNGWGIGELLYQKLFATYGAPYVASAADPGHVMGTRGFALSVLYRLHLTLWSLLGGICLLFERDRVTKADIETEVRLEEQDEPPASGAAS